MLDTDIPNPNSKLWINFYPGKVPNEAMSRETGKPEFNLVDFIRKAAAGDPLNIIERPVRESDKQEFSQQWHAYKNNQAYRPENGTPIEDWPRLDVATVAKLKSLEFHTVEQVADASDAQIQRIGMGCFEMRTRALAYIKAAKDSSFTQKQAEELEKRDRENAELRELLAKTNARLEVLEGDREEKRGPGRPRREAA